MIRAGRGKRTTAQNTELARRREGGRKEGKGKQRETQPDRGSQKQRRRDPESMREAGTRQRQSRKRQRKSKTKMKRPRLEERERQKKGLGSLPSRDSRKLRQGQRWLYPRGRGKTTRVTGELSGASCPSIWDTPPRQRLSPGSHAGCMREAGAPALQTPTQPACGSGL